MCIVKTRLASIEFIAALLTLENAKGGREKMQTAASSICLCVSLSYTLCLIKQNCQKKSALVDLLTDWLEGYMIGKGSDTDHIFKTKQKTHPSFQAC